MNNYDIPRNFVAVLAALVLALVLTLTPNAGAFAEEISTVDISHREAAPQDADLLRRLLSDPNLSPQEQRQLDHALSSVFEELA